MPEIKSQKTNSYTEGRFEFALTIVDESGVESPICIRNFQIPNYFEGSFYRKEFTALANSFVEAIQRDLESKSRVHAWYYCDTEEYSNPSVKPGSFACYFKFSMRDNKHVVYERIFDASVYPKSVREHVDLTNRIIKFTTRYGETFNYNKNDYFEANKGRLPQEMYVLKSMINDKNDLTSYIIDTTVKFCSRRNKNSISKIPRT